jgi:Flp pilus assembly protein TadD
MSTRSPWTALLAAAVLLAALPLCANELQDIEKLYRAGDVQQALRKADEAIAAQPRAAQIRFLKGVMLSDLKRHAQAIEVFTALTQDFPELPDPYNNLAVLYAAEGQLQNALTALQTALRNDPKHRAARENLGDVHLALAVQAWTAAQVGSKGDDAGLQRKLKLAREIQAHPG